ncbi:MAG: TIGR02099 family protein [Burkholderiaceae bacterium]|nr:TIGR02099 family protein [Burkholderiaceae bacterium]
MNDPATHPTRLLKFMAVVARWSLGVLLAAALLITLAWGALHGWIVPRIGEYRAQIQAQASKALGVPVRVGAISARSEGLIPTIELENVALLDAEGREALRLPRVVVAVSPRSLWNFGFEQLYIERPELDVRRTADGRILLAGLALSSSNPDDGGAAADWIFAQPELLIRGGTLRWTDELRAAPELALDDVDIVVRNGNWRHSLRIDATPPEAWGDRFSVIGVFRQPLFTTHGGRWQEWNGQLYADFRRVDVSRLRHHADVGITVSQGRGAVRSWIDVERGQLVGGVADVALADVNATLGAQLQPLVLPLVQGRVGGRHFAGGLEFFTQKLQFTTQEGLRWPGGNVRVRHSAARKGAKAQGEFQADLLDLAALSGIADRVPLGDAVHQALRTYTPQGLVESLNAQWQGDLTSPQTYQARGRVTGLALAGAPENSGKGAAPAIGVRGAAVDFDLTQQGGKAKLVVADGALVLPGVFEEPVLPLDRLSSAVAWQIDGARIAVQVTDTRFANADAQGEARATWHTSDPAHSRGGGRFPGVLDLSGSLSRADGTRVHRYLPLSIPSDARHYVRDSVVAGRASVVNFRVRGDLHDMPFNDPRHGEFRIAARVQDVTYAFVPRSLQPAGELPWPALTQLAGELVFERSSMQVKGASSRFAGSADLRATKVEAQIPDLSHTVVAVNADTRGPLPELLALMASSPLAAMTGHALDKASGTGFADLRLRLSLPISEINKSRVQGSLQLAGNEVRITPDTPALSRARGTVQFSESGFTLAGVQARALGGDVRLEGGMRALPAGAPPSEALLQLRAQGTASAEGLRQAPELGLLAQLARKATGSAPYSFQFALRRGVPELQVSSSLLGLALALPAPLGKPADSAMPVRFENQLTRESLAPGAVAARTAPLLDRLALEVGGVGSVSYVRDLAGASPRVLRGAIAMGLAPEESAPMPERGVVGNVRLGDFDVDLWQSLVTGAPGQAGASSVPSVLQDYLPTVLAARARSLTVQGRTLHDVLVGGGRDGLLWRANLDAQELNGYVEFRQPNGPEAAAGRLYARLARLIVPQSAASQVEALLDAQPGSLPSLDIAVDDFELRGRKLGRLEIEAQNRVLDGAQREWRLGKFNLLMPEAVFTANGNWAALQATAAGASPGAQRRTVLNFRLDILDSGQLLGRIGMADVVRRGKGRMEGQVAWRGAPINPDYASMTGQINLNIEAGQFLKAEPGLAKLLGVLSLQSLPRRLTLDFRDVFSEGFAFDFVRGDLRIDQGVAMTNNLQMKGVNAAVLMEGRADIARETQELHVVVVPEINAMTASLVATAINPVIGLGSFLAQVFLRGPLIEAATQEFRVDGTWTEPQVTRIARRSRSADTAPAAPSVPASAPQAPPARTAQPPGEPS